MALKYDSKKRSKRDILSLKILGRLIRFWIVRIAGWTEKPVLLSPWCPKLFSTMKQLKKQLINQNWCCNPDRKSRNGVASKAWLGRTYENKWTPQANISERNLIYSLKKDGISNTKTDIISKRPRIMLNERYNLPTSLMTEKLLTGPTRLKPGPMPPSVVITLLDAVYLSNPVNVMIKVPKTIVPK